MNDTEYDHSNGTTKEFKTKTLAITTETTKNNYKAHTHKKVEEYKIQSHSCIWQGIMRDNFNDTIENRNKKKEREWKWNWRQNIKKNV